jgi:hypothetical protein
MLGKDPGDTTKAIRKEPGDCDPWSFPLSPAAGQVFECLHNRGSGKKSFIRIFGSVKV